MNVARGGCSASAMLGRSRRLRRFGSAGRQIFGGAVIGTHLSPLCPMAAVAAGFLRRVQRVVGAADQSWPTSSPGHELRHAQAAGDLERFAVASRDRCFDRRANSLGHDAGAGRVGRRQNHGKFLAAVAAGQVHIAATGC